MAKLYQDLLKKSVDSGKINQNTVDARNWLRDEASTVSTAKAVNDVKSQMLDSGRTTVTIGKLYMFSYNPKHSDTLPYYDTFPVVFPFEKVSGGFMGINMHYLPHTYRALLMDQLYTLINNDNYDDSTRLQRLSYEVLKGASRFRYFRPCLKRYLNSGIKSRFIYVHPKHWDMALFLPLERFEKATNAQVFKESLKAIRGYR